MRYTAAKIMRLFTLIALSLSIVACGFHLRSSADLSETIGAVTISSSSGSNNFDRALRIALTKSGIIILDESQDNKDILNLRINKITSSDLELGRDASNDLSQIKRTLTTYYFVRQSDGKSIYGPREISTSRTLTNQNDDASAKLSYNTAQAYAMHDELAEKIVDDLRYVQR